MTTIISNKLCGNSPKNNTVRDFLVALARGDAQDLSQLLAGDVAWHPVGRKSVDGIDAVLKAMVRHGAAQRVTIESVLSHGRLGAVEGVVTLSDGVDRAYCHIVEFTNAKCIQIGSVKSFTQRL